MEPHHATEQELEVRMQAMEPHLTVRQGTHLGMDDRWHTPMAECQALERRWAELLEEALQLGQEWQQLLSIVTSRVEAKQNGQLPSWTDGALIFHDLDRHAARWSNLAHEALQTCHQYALALQRAMARQPR